jgi:cytochrome oxidase Cu insertion factor (SCO1/SenC/PrrC family)
LLIELSSALKVGSPAYPFTLPDSTGKMVSLKDFTGKLVIVDCWFTGCAACAELAKVIDDQVLPKYIDNKNVVFVSVCVDKTVEKWKTSLKSGEYTNAKSINLFTEGLALNHPFIKNYQFHGFPQLLLIDKKGNIFTPALPREPAEMIEVIEQALKAN